MKLFGRFLKSSEMKEKKLWQRGRDSNPRKLALYTRSRRAPSTTRTPLYTQSKHLALHKKAKFKR